MAAPLTPAAHSHGAETAKRSYRPRLSTRCRRMDFEPRRLARRNRCAALALRKSAGGQHIQGDDRCF